MLNRRRPDCNPERKTRAKRKNAKPDQPKKMGYTYLDRPNQFAQVFWARISECIVPFIARLLKRTERGVRSGHEEGDSVEQFTALSAVHAQFNRVWNQSENRSYAFKLTARDFSACDCRRAADERKGREGRCGTSNASRKHLRQNDRVNQKHWSGIH